nr:DUF4259 domain-containing protein [Streptomyces niveiscabiei]
MGTWGTAPFDNDSAADFGGALDEIPAENRPAAVRERLLLATDDRPDGRSGDRADAYVEAPDAEQAVAAAALVAAQCPGGEPVDPVYGPEEPLPDLTPLRPLAV